MPMKKSGLLLALLILVLMLTACAVQPPAAQPPTDEVEASALPQPDVRTPEPTRSASAAVPEASTTPEAAVPTAAEPAAEITTEDQPLYDGIPTGQTEQGFPFLGQPDAPVTVIDYSDFL